MGFISTRHDEDDCVKDRRQRLFQTAMIDEDIQDNLRFTSIVYLPGPEVEEHEGWFIDSGAETHSSVSAAAAKLINKWPGSTR